MDRLESLGTTLSQITMYDIKTMYNQVSCGWWCMGHTLTSDLLAIVFRPKNVVLNVSEIEAKVREATNDDPW